MSSEIDNPQPEERAKPKRTIQVSQTPTHVSVYANNAIIGLNYFDFRIRFGEIVNSNQESLEVVNDVTIVMTPEHAKTLADLLTRNVARYEEQFGKIRDLPKQEE